MREVFEKLEVADEMFEATRLPEIFPTYLLFFFHVDVIDSEVVSLGYYTSNQQQYFTALKLGKTGLSERAKQLGFVSDRLYKLYRNREETVECKDEKDALLDFLSNIEKHNTEYKTRPVLVSLNIREQVSKLFKRFRQYGLLERALGVISAVGSVEEFWLKSKREGFSEKIKKGPPRA